MQIRVEELINCRDQHTVNIGFSSEYGSSMAQWIGEIPALGELYDVEFDIDDSFVWGNNISTTMQDKSSITVLENIVILVGAVISLEKDGCLSIALGDSVVLLEVENAPKDISGWVECHAVHVKVFSISL